MNILIVAPTHREFLYMNRALESAKGLRNTYRTVGNGTIGKALSAVMVTEALCSEKFDLVAVIGFAAGTLGYRQGQIVEPKATAYHDIRAPKGFIPELEEIYPTVGKDDSVIYTGDAFVDAMYIAEFKHESGTEHALFDMEATAVAAAARSMGSIPLLVMKFISDVPENTQDAHDFERFANTHSDFSPFVERLENFSL